MHFLLLCSNFYSSKLCLTSSRLLSAHSKNVTWHAGPLECSRELKSHCMCNRDKAATLEKCPGFFPSLSHAHCQLSSCEWELDKECEMRESWKMESEWEDERKNCTGAAFHICHRSYLVHLFILCLFSRFQHPRNEGVFTLWLRKPQITSLLSAKVKRSFPHGQQKQAQTMSRAVWEVLKVQENTKHVYRDCWWKLSDKPAKQHQAPATKRNSWCRREKFPSWSFFSLTSKICTHLQMRTDSIR